MGNTGRLAIAALALVGIVLAAQEVRQAGVPLDQDVKGRETLVQKWMVGGAGPHVIVAVPPGPCPPCLAEVAEYAAIAGELSQGEATFSVHVVTRDETERNRVRKGLGSTVFVSQSEDIRADIFGGQVDLPIPSVFILDSPGGRVIDWRRVATSTVTSRASKQVWLATMLP